MIEKITDWLTLLVIGAVAIRLITNPQTANTLNSIFHGVAEDITASVGG
jgi:hypothetical protein